MSDDEYSYEYEYDEDEDDKPMDDDEDEGFEYTDDDADEVDDVGVTLENGYYNAKGHRDQSEFKEAVDLFENVIKTEGDALCKEYGDDDDTVIRFGQWSYKSIKQLAKMSLRSKDYAKAKEAHQRLLDCISSPNLSGVSPNAIEKGVNAMLERVSYLLQGSNVGITDTATSSVTPQQLARHVYDGTLSLFHTTNERLWFKTNLKYGQLLYEMNETAKLQAVIRDLLKCSNSSSASGENSTSAVSSSTNLMEIYALQIQLYSRQKDNKKLREIFNKAMRVKDGIPHPRTFALIQELGGKMHMSSREFEAAGSCFFQAFKSYDEAGDVARLRCLKYLVLASMLDSSSINPFDSQEVRAYKNDPEIVAMTNLVEAFHNNEIHKFEMILAKNGGEIMNDEFVSEYLGDLLRTVRTQVLCKVVKPYTRISLKAISKELNGVSTNDVESLLVGLILDGRLKGRIDQINGFLIKSVDNMGNSADDSMADDEIALGVDVSSMAKDSLETKTLSSLSVLASELEFLSKTITLVGSKGQQGSSIYGNMV